MPQLWTIPRAVPITVAVAAISAAGALAGTATLSSGTVSLYSDDYLTCLQPRGDCYAPYRRKTCTTMRSRSWQAVTLENDFIRVVVLPELGGRVLRFVNKTTGSNQYYDNPSGVKSTGWGRFGWWMATGGTEIMLPWDEHGGCFYEPFDDHPAPDPGRTYKTEDTADGVKLTMVFREANLGLARWLLEIELFLPDDHAYYQVTKHVTNESGSSQQLECWQNTMISPGPGNMLHTGAGTNLNQQIVFDQNVTQLYNHNDNAGETFWGNPWSVVSWPVHTGPWHGGGNRSIDISRVRNWYDFGLQYAGLFTRSTQPSTYFGQYNLDADEGIAIVFPSEIAPGITTGVKYWHWGSFSGSASPSFADGSSTYCELMTGPVRVFENDPLECFPSETHPTGEAYRIFRNAGSELVWTETYLSPEGIGTLVKATQRAALNLQVPSSGTIGSPIQCTLGAYLTQAADNVRVTLSVDGVVFYAEGGLAIAPDSARGPYFREVNIPLWSAATGARRVRMTVHFSDNSTEWVEQPMSISGTPTTPTPSVPPTSTPTNTPAAPPTPLPGTITWDQPGSPTEIDSIAECTGGWGGDELALVQTGVNYQGRACLSAAIELGCSYWVWNFTGLPSNTPLRISLDVNVDCAGNDSWLEIYWRDGLFTAGAGKAAMGEPKARWSSTAEPHATNGWTSLVDSDARSSAAGTFTVAVERQHWSASPPVVAAYFDNLRVAPDYPTADGNTLEAY